MCQSLTAGGMASERPGPLAGPGSEGAASARQPDQWYLYVYKVRRGGAPAARLRPRRVVTAQLPAGGLASEADDSAADAPGGTPGAPCCPNRAIKTLRIRPQIQNCPQRRPHPGTVCPYAHAGARAAGARRAGRGGAASIPGRGGRCHACRAEHWQRHAHAAAAGGGGNRGAPRAARVGVLIQGRGIVLIAQDCTPLPHPAADPPTE